MRTRLKHLWLIIRRLPAILFFPARRQLLFEALTFSRNLPAVLKQPLPDAMQQLTPTKSIPEENSPGTLRDIADLTALLNRSSPLGLCLRRSLTRYHFLRKAGVPLEIQFGARFVDGKPDRQITGHAWVTLNGKPYFEADENWRDFTVMLTYPPDSSLDNS